MYRRNVHFFGNAVHFNRILFNSKKLYCTNCKVGTSLSPWSTQTINFHYVLINMNYFINNGNVFRETYLRTLYSIMSIHFFIHADQVKVSQFFPLQGAPSSLCTLHLRSAIQLSLVQIYIVKQIFLDLVSRISLQIPSRTLRLFTTSSSRIQRNNWAVVPRHCHTS